MAIRRGGVRGGYNVGGLVRQPGYLEDPEAGMYAGSAVGRDPASTTQPVGDPRPLTPQPGGPEEPPPTADGGMPQGGSWGANYEWAGPEAAALSWGDPSRMGGFNTGGWGTNERGTDSFKNTFGKIASRYDPTQAGSLDAIMADPDFKRFFPKATKAGFDKIDFGDGNPVDVWVAASQNGGGKNWAWQTSGQGTAAPSSNVSSLLTPAAARAQLPGENLKTWMNPETGQEEWLFMDPSTGEVISPEAYEQLVRAGRRPPMSAVSRRGRPGASHITDLLATEPELI